MNATTYCLGAMTRFPVVPGWLLLIEYPVDQRVQRKTVGWRGKWQYLTMGCVSGSPETQAHQALEERVWWSWSSRNQLSAVFEILELVKPDVLEYEGNMEYVRCLVVRVVVVLPQP
jgi:hypothetical protein